MSATTDTNPAPDIEDIIFSKPPTQLTTTTSSTPPAISVPAAPAPHPYTIVDSGIFMHSDDGDVQLTNFAARIVADVRRTDGTDFEPLYLIHTILAGERKEFWVAAGRFDGLAWVAEQLGGRAVIEPVSGVKKHISTAIRKLSAPEQQTIATHTGWMQTTAGPIYLTAGDPIGATEEAVDVDLPQELSRFALAAPKAGDDFGAAVKASLALLNLADDTVMVPLLAAAYRAPLGPADFCVHLYGQTGRFKSSIAALIQQHFGTELDLAHLPASWASTSNALEGLAHAAKDILLIIDDYVPTEPDAQKKAERLLRAQGNNTGRSRLTGAGTVRSARYPRGLILSTGEDLPRGQSIRARTVSVEISHDAVNVDRLTELQERDEAQLRALAMSGYIRWLAEHHDRVCGQFDRDVADHRDMFDHPGQHRRTASNVANLMVGLQRFMEFARDCRAITVAEHDELRARCLKALRSAAVAQIDQNQSETQKFLELLRVALATGKAHLGRHPYGIPTCRDRWGWRYDYSKSTPRGAMIGWLEEDERRDGDRRRIEDKSIYLLPDATYRAVQSIAGSSESQLRLAPRALWKALHEEGLLASVELNARGTRTVRKVIHGERRTVLHLPADSIYPKDTESNR